MLIIQTSLATEFQGIGHCSGHHPNLEEISKPQSKGWLRRGVECVADDFVKDESDDGSQDIVDGKRAKRKSYSVACVESSTGRDTAP